MKEMNERAKKILDILIRRPDYRVSDLERVLHLTRRQINYSIGQINEWLSNKKLPELKRNKAGDFFLPQEIVQIAGVTQVSENDKVAFFSDTERIELLLLYLIINDEFISLAHITDVSRVSKNTALSDLKNAAKFAERYLLTIEYSRSDGYYIEGSEKQIRMLLNDTLQKKTSVTNVKRPLSAYITIRKDEVIHFIRSVEKKMNVKYADESFDYLVEVISYTLSRINSHRVNEKNFFENQVIETPEYTFVRRSLMPTWQLSQSDIEWLTLLFLTSNTYLNNFEGENDLDLVDFVHEMVDQFQRQTFIQVDDRIKFEQRLFNHLRPAYFRIKYGLKLGNFGLSDVISDNKHAILIHLMKDLIQPLEQHLGKSFPDNELELLSFYFGHQLSETKEQEVPKKRAVIVCTNGLIVSKMMMATLTQLFPELHFLASLSASEFMEFETDFDLVFTTIPLDTSLPQYVVKPLMEYQEQINLRYRVLKEVDISSLKDVVNELLEIINDNAEISNLKALRSSLEKFFISNKENSKATDFKILPPLHRYLKEDYIQISDEKLDWQTAIKIACAPLIQHGVISDRFVAEVIKQTEDPQNYSFLGKSVAIPHATAEYGVMGEGIACLVSKQPIIYPNGKEVHIVAPIAVINLTQHLRAINQLSDFASDDALINKITHMTKVSEVYSVMRDRR